MALRPTATLIPPIPRSRSSQTQTSHQETTPTPTWVRWKSPTASTTFLFHQTPMMLPSRTSTLDRVRSPSKLNQTTQKLLKSVSESNLNQRENSRTVPSPRKRKWKMLQKTTGKITNSSMVMAQKPREKPSMSMILEFTPSAATRVHRDKKTLTDGMARPTTKAKPTGARATKTHSTRKTQMHPQPSPDMANLQKVFTPLKWADINLSVPKDRVTLLLAPKISMTQPVEIESFCLT